MGGRAKGLNPEEYKHLKSRERKRVKGGLRSSSASVKRREK